LKLKSLNIFKSKEKDFNVSDGIFDIEPRKDIIARVVRWQLAKKRSGNHKVKSRSEVKSTTAKIYRQKGTGRARHGPSSVVQFRGGGVVHGPVVRNHSHKLPKKIRLLGLKSALSLKAKGGNLNILENDKFDGKTKTFEKAINKSSLKNILIVASKKDDEKNIYFAIKNIPNVDLISQIGLNVYDIVKKEYLLITEQAINEIEERLK
jgi:large subunit ribosomal protein L4|tara:strand:- start:187 stop:807 length:621 start_codon:yes stop_codon:yes gene_type:complete